MSWPQVAARGVGFDSGKPRDKLFLGKLFHPCLGHKWRKGGWGSGSQLGSGRDGWGWRVKALCELCYVWGLIVENPAKSYFRESYSIHVLATSGGKGVGVRGAGFNIAKLRAKLFSGKLFHPCLGHQWWKVGGGRAHNWAPREMGGVGG